MSQPTRHEILEGPASRAQFAAYAFQELLARRNDVNVVLVQGYALAALAANFAARVTGVRTAMIICSPVEAYYRCRLVHADPAKPFHRHELLGLEALARLNAGLGTQYLVLSPYLESVVRGHGARARVNVVPVYGVNTSVFTPARETRQSLRARLGLPTSGSLLFFSSRIAPEKDAETMLRALGLVAKTREVRVLNRAGGHRRFLELARELGVAEHVVATDAVHPLRELPASYQASDLCVQASREEGLGFSPLEALACGVPVVSAAVGGLLDTIRPGETGWTYPVGDEVALAERIEEVLGDPNRGSAARERRASARPRAVRALTRSSSDLSPRSLEQGRSGPRHASHSMATSLATTSQSRARRRSESVRRAAGATRADSRQRWIRFARINVVLGIGQEPVCELFGVDLGHAAPGGRDSRDR